MESNHYHPKYSQAVRSNEHTYGEYIEKIDFIQIAEKKLKNSNPENLVEKLGEMFYQEHREDLPNRNTRSAAYQKSKSLVRRNQKGHSKLLQQFNGKKGYRKAIKEAIELGYIRNIQFDVPWHPKLWSDENKLTTIPWQHKYAVLYTGRKAVEFASAEYTKARISSYGPSAEEKCSNIRSTLVKGYISPDSRHSLDKQTAKEKANTVQNGGGSPKLWGIYLTSDINYPDQYAQPDDYLRTEPILEVEVPSKFLIMPGLRDGAEMGFISSIEDYFEEKESPKELEELHYQGNRTHGENEIIYTQRNSDNKPVLPLQYVNGVWDYAQDDHPYFRPLKEYIQHIYSIERTPSGSKIREYPASVLPPRNRIRLEVGASDNKEFQRNHNKRDKQEVRLLKISEYLSKQLAGYSTLGSLYRLRNNETRDGLRPISSRAESFGHLCEGVARLTVLSIAFKQSLKPLGLEVESKSIENIDLENFEHNTELGEKLVEESEKIHKYINNQIESQEDLFEKHMERYSQLEPIIGNKEYLVNLAENLAEDKEEFQKFCSVINWESNIKSAEMDIEDQTGMEIKSLEKII